MSSIFFKIMNFPEVFANWCKGHVTAAELRQAYVYENRFSRILDQYVDGHMSPYQVRMYYNEHIQSMGILEAAIERPDYVSCTLWPREHVKLQVNPTLIREATEVYNEGGFLAMKIFLRDKSR